MQHPPPGTPDPSLRSQTPADGANSQPLSTPPPNPGDPTFRAVPLPPLTAQASVVRFLARPPSAPQDVEWDTGTPLPFHLSSMTGVTRVEVYLGLGLDRSLAVAHAVWESFVREVIVAEFPEGVFLVGGTGAYQGNLEPSRKIEAVVAGNPQSRVERVAAEWLRRAHQAEVLAILTPLNGKVR